MKAAPLSLTASRLKAALCALIFTSAALLSGCETTPGAPPSESQPVASQPGSASELLERAKSASPEQAAGLYLEAGLSFLDLDDLKAAASAFDALEPGWLPRDRLPDYHLLAAAVALSRNDLEAARTALRQVSGPTRLSTRARQVQAMVCAADSDYACSVAELIELAGDDTAYNEEIWSYLNLNSNIRSVQLPVVAERPSTRLDGWQTLHRITVTSFSSADARRQIAAWRTRHPQHPAAILPPAAVAALSADAKPAPHIGLLLPLSGPLARAGEAVRDGFVSAMLLAGASAAIEVTIYDTADEPIPVLYERLLADGVELIIGPLQKDQATSLNTVNPTVPVLVLNYLDGDLPPANGLMQLGLAIEDEAHTIARRLQADRVTSALLFHNYDDWSLRARRTLAEEAAASLTIQPFTDMRTITEAVGTAMHVQDSVERRDDLARILGLELEFLPRAREDVDAVIALIDNGEANALVPALRFHFADELPIYASSQVTRRTRNEQLTELSGFHVSELPWFLEGDPTYGVMRDAFDLDRNPFSSLVALGSDAFRVADRVSTGAADAELILLGSTGLLHLGSDGRIHRELAWGRIAGSRVSLDLGGAP